MNQLIKSFHNTLKTLKDNSDYCCALINTKNNSINYFDNDWDLIDYLKCSDQEYIYVDHTRYIDKMKIVTGKMKRTTTESHELQIGLVELHNC